MKSAIMQPYYFPYIGYFQLIESVDLFIVYDNIKYTKKGWVNRNRILQNGKGTIFSLNLSKDSDYLDVCDRELSATYNYKKFLNQIRENYQRAPFFKQTFPLIEEIAQYEEVNLFKFIHNSIVKICDHLGIKTKIQISSAVSIDHSLKSQSKVLALCQAVGSSTYINAIGGIDLYAKNDFLEKGVSLKFIKSKSFEYPQFSNKFIPWLSIIDVMMFNSINNIHNFITNEYELI